MDNDINNNNLIKSNQILSKYMSELTSDVTINMHNIREKSLMSSSIWSKWLNYLFIEKENLQRITDAKKKLLEKKMQSNVNVDSILKLKSEEKISQNDETMKKLQNLYKQTQDNIDYIEKALNILQNFGFNIKNCLESFKLQFEH